MSLSSNAIKEFALESGACACRIADLGRLRGIHTDPPDLLEPYRRAVSLAVRLTDGILDPIEDKPTALYQSHYMQVNQLLDDMALSLAGLIEGRGGKALPVPASQILDREGYTSYISHKAVAVAAGVGWQGKSLLTINPEHGPRIRLVSVLTDLPLAVDEPIRNRCGDCTDCADACPVQAIRGESTESHFESRDEALRFSRCATRLTRVNTRLEHIQRPICGVCVRACPVGQA